MAALRTQPRDGRLWALVPFLACLACNATTQAGYPDGGLTSGSTSAGSESTSASTGATEGTASTASTMSASATGSTSGSDVTTSAAAMTAGSGSATTASTSSSSGTTGSGTTGLGSIGTGSSSSGSAGSTGSSVGGTTGSVDCATWAFGEPVSYPAPLGSGNLVVADFNSDGIPDIVVANGEATQNNDGVVTLFLGTADGGLGPPASFNAGSSFYPGTVAAGDLNGDGLLDLAVIGGYGSNTVSILLGDGGGGFAPPIQSIVDPATAAPGESLLFETYQVAIGNFAGGTQQDLAILYSDQIYQNGVASGGGSTALVIYAGFSGTVLGSPTTYPLTTLPDQTAAIALGDFDGDGADDLAMVWSYAVGNQGMVYGSGAVFLSKSQKVDQIFNFGGPVGAIAAADFTGDGNLDLAIGTTDVYDQGSIDLYQGAGDGSFTFKSSYDAGILPISLAAADFNGDGVPDLAMSGQSPTSTILVNTIGLMYGLQDGGLSEPTFASAQGANVTGVLWPTVLALDVRGEPGVAVVGNSTDGGFYVTLLAGVCQ